MVDRGLKTQSWLVIWDCLTRMKNASLCNDRRKGRWASRPSLTKGVGVMKINVSDLNYFTIMKFVSSKLVICR